MLELREGGRCYPETVEGVNVGLACVDGVIAFLAFYQEYSCSCQSTSGISRMAIDAKIPWGMLLQLFVNLLRIHSRNSQLGWTRQKVSFLKSANTLDDSALYDTGSVESRNSFFLYFVLTLVAACKGWICWSNSCGFIVMAFPKILFIAAFLLLLSFWVDLCHQSNDDDEDEGCSPQEALLEKRNKTDSNANGRRRCCSFRSHRIGSRQKIVILVTVLVFAIMIASSMLIWIGMGKSPIDSAVVYVDLIAVAVLLLGGALACYGLKLFLKMRKVRADRASWERWKVAGLAIVSLISFTSSASVAIGTNVPLLYNWHEQQIDGVYTSLLLVLYYFIGSSVPSAFVLFVMKELPPPVVINRQQESRTITFISDGSVPTHPQRWIAATSVQNQGNQIKLNNDRDSLGVFGNMPSFRCALALPSGPRASPITAPQ
ncbi:hypothetical protein DH2020_042166 [Rehmannia glutinosa]|uniref:THH1/TOM1/TOM3 domain-containing protein n=1 Tax=Rehmannia glutinosa TaxID=99300 RepID=A0ABR0UP67_REHGL